MELRQKLNLLTSNNTVAELSEMLMHAHVSISWWGQRLVSVDGYEGSVEINELALKYLGSAPFRRMSESSLNDRLTCENLWGRVQQLYTDSHTALSRTLMYKYLVPMREFRPYCRACAGDPMAIMEEWTLLRQGKAFFSSLQLNLKDFGQM